MGQHILRIIARIVTSKRLEVMIVLRLFTGLLLLGNTSQIAKIIPALFIACQGYAFPHVKCY